jgi:DNA-binding winged helix-turn-helix (wHTH) protein
MPGVSYRFGNFRLDYDTRQLFQDGAEIHLSPKAFELLALLLANRPRAMSKADLLERLWPSTFVEETNIAGLVAEIRQALGDSATRPVFLRTVYRFGYQFVGDVVEVGAPAPAGSAWRTWGARTGRSWITNASHRLACPTATNCASARSRSRSGSIRHRDPRTRCRILRIRLLSCCPRPASPQARRAAIPLPVRRA